MANPAPTSPITTRRARGRTNTHGSGNGSATRDDDALPQTLQSPAKILALRELKDGVGGSRSTDDLHALLSEAREREGEQGHEGGAEVAKVVAGSNGSPTKTRQELGKSQEVKTNSNGHPPPRPALKKLRRRSTLEWANATPQRRQETLENVAAERVADVFFSVHVGAFEGW